MVVQFTNKSTNSVKYEWDLGNGNRSMLPSPSAIYYQAGTYTITLKAIDSSGKSASKSATIQVLKDPLSAFSFSAKSACEGEIVSFTENAIEGDTTINLWSWDFGDGNLDTGQNVSHVFKRSGQFAISLYVKDANGCDDDTVIKQGLTIWPLPIAEFDIEETQYCTPPAKVNFINESWRGTPHTYEWDFDDGGTSTDADPSHTYQKLGTYTPRIIVTSANGCKDTFETSIKIEIYPLNADFNLPADICGPDLVSFKNNTYPDPSSTKYKWYIDGKLANNKKNPFLNLNPGKHKIKLEASDSGCFDEIEKEILVKTTPQGTLSVSPEVICKVPEDINLSFVPDTFGSYKWYIDGKLVSTDAKYKFTAQVKKDYQIKLVVEDDGCVNEFNYTVKASTPNFQVLRDTSGCAPLPVQFKIIDNSKNGLASFKWKFGDGDSSSMQNPSHTYYDTGSFTVKVTVTDSFGCEGEQTVLVESGLKIKPDLTFDNSPVCNGDTTKFFNLTKEIPVRPHWYIWTIGDSMTITPTKKDLKYIYHQMPGDKEVILSTDHYGCKDSIIADQTILVKAPFSLPVIEGPDCAPARFKFIDKSAGATSRRWLNPPVDGKKDSIIGLTLTPGKYLVGLATYSSVTGCTDTSYVKRELRQTPKLSIVLSTNPDCPPVTSNITVSTEFATFVEYSLYDQVEYMTISKSEQVIDKEFNNLPSDFKITIKARNSSCYKDTVIFVDGNGPVADANAEISGNCYPYTLKLYDRLYGKDNFEHFWRIGNLKTIPVTSANMTYVLKDKIPGYDTIPVELFVRNDTCQHSKLFKFPVDTRDVILNHDLDEFCNSIKHQLRFKHSQKVDIGTYQTWGINDQWDNDPSSDFSYVYDLEKDGIDDTLKLRVHYSEECVTQYPFITEDDGKGTIAAFGFDTAGSICPPLFVNFSDKSKSVNQIISWEWELGDGSSSIQQNPGKIYFEPGSYGIRLAIADSKGCTDTTYLPDIIVVDGPKAELLIEPLIGCVPLLVQFTGSSEDSVLYSWDLGDGYIENGQKLSHLYTLPGTYTPLLTISDQNDCKYTLPPKERIRVLPYPKADFTFTEQCINDTTFFNFTGDSSGRITRISWDFGNDSTASGTTDTNFTYTERGDYFVSVAIENEGGCADSISKKVRIYGADPAFIKSEPGICIDEEITLTDLSKADTTIISKTWLVDSVVMGHSDILKVSIPVPGIYPLELIIETEMGCSYSTIDSSGLIVSDTLPLEPAVIRRVSVLDDFSVEIKIDEQKDMMLSEHSVWMEDTNGALSKIKNFGKEELLTEIGGLNTLQNVYCMMVKRESYCPTPYPDTPASYHCTVELKAKGIGPRNHLEWTPYIGWDTVKEYEIYSKQELANNYSYLATVPGDQLTYIDSTMLCRDERRYHIKALEQGGFEEYSWSDTAHAVPKNGYPVKAPEVWRTSVEEDLYTILEWVVPDKSKVPLKEFEIYKRPANGDEVESISHDFSSSMDIADYKVWVDDESYIYKVRATDTCGNLSPWSNIGKTVLLTVGFDEEIYSPKLSWTKYSLWNEGVEKYLIERMNENGQFDIIGQSEGPDDTTYIDPQAYQICNPNFCYRVTAIRNQPDNFPDSTHDVISHSNVQCSPVESHLYTPNAFTMNKDGLNETFQPIGMYMRTYELEIYDRWGALLFRTNECFGNWDGTFQGRPCPVETYVYIVEGFGADGRFHRRVGTVHLLK